VGLDASSRSVKGVLAIRGELPSIIGDALISMLEELVTDGDDGAKRIGVTFTK